METNKIYNGECIEILKTIPRDSIDCIVTSPPYWKGFEYEAYFNSYKQYLDWSKEWLKECKRVLKPNGTMWLNVINDSEITIRAFELMDLAGDIAVFRLNCRKLVYFFRQKKMQTVCNAACGGEVMAHKEKHCAYWHCRRNGGTTCWNWGGKFAGRACPQNDSCEHWRTCEMCNGVMGQCKKKKEVEKTR